MQSKGVVAATKQPGNLKPEVERGGGGVEPWEQRLHLNLNRVRCTHVVERWFRCRRCAKRERQRWWKWWWRQLFLGSKPRPQRLRRSSRQWCAVQCLSQALRQEVTTSVAQGGVVVLASVVVDVGQEAHVDHR